MDGSSSLRLAFVAVALTVIGTRSDSTSARLPGYGGVLPVPVASDSAGDSVDPIAIRHVAGLIERGRVLYAAGHAAAPKPADHATASARTHRVCPQQLVQARAGQVPTT